MTTSDLATSTNRRSEIANGRHRSLLARRLGGIAGGIVLTGGALVGLGVPAHADGSYAALYGMGSTVGGSSSTDYYSPAQFYPQTTCTANTRSVATSVYASPRNRSGGQHFLTRIWARDVTYGAGAWSAYGWVQNYIPEYNSMSYAMADYRHQNSSSFSGYRGHSYQIFVEAYVASGAQWVDIHGKFSNHYSSWGAYEPNVYGQTIQNIPGAASSSCKIM